MTKDSLDIYGLSESIDQFAYLGINGSGVLNRRVGGEAKGEGGTKQQSFLALWDVGRRHDFSPVLAIQLEQAPVFHKLCHDPQHQFSQVIKLFTPTTQSLQQQLPSHTSPTPFLCKTFRLLLIRANTVYKSVYVIMT
jgi:hypothetical protein